MHLDDQSEADEIRAARGAIRELYEFIRELDPAPMPIEAYIVDSAARGAASRVFATGSA